MKICICTTPIRPVPTEFPPFGSMAIIQSLRQVGEEAQFYNIDYFRPQHGEIKDYFERNRFDIVGISAVVSTAYVYTRYLASLIRSVSPKTVIVVGGNLAASSEILLRKCDVDFCVVGDGESTIQNLVRALYDRPLDDERMKQIRGICFLDREGRFHFTGYATPLPADDLAWPDYGILEADGSLPHFISDKLDIFHDQVSPEETQGRRVASVITTKGCVARCTFCHRWERGYRRKPVDQVIHHIQHLQKRYNVGFISISDENFGSDHKLAHSLATRLGEMGIWWRAAGVRARSVTPEMLQHWKANGCVATFFGIESGSQKMLDVMEKNVTVERNIDALRWTHEAGLFTIIQLVLGMPGEDDQTIRETIAFLKEVTPNLFLDGNLPSALMSINYAQALPGTPLYEYARKHGFIGRTADEEEEYLTRISDIDAYSTDHFVNYTGQPLLKVLMWRYWMAAEVDAHFIQHMLGITMSFFQVVRHFAQGFVRWAGKRQGITARAISILTRRRQYEDPIAQQLIAQRHSDYTRSGYFNIKSKGYQFAPLFLNSFTRRWFYPLLAVFAAIKHASSFGERFSLIAGHLRWSLVQRFARDSILPRKSLRKVVDIVPDAARPGEEDMMVPLRLGR